MMERDIVSRKKKEFQIQEYIKEKLRGVGLSHSKVQRTPLGEKIIITAARPGLIIGGGGANIKKLTKELKIDFNLENPQIEINEVENINLIAEVVAERIATSLEKFGSMRFKGIGHKVMSDVLGAGAKGIEILISGKIPSARARRWRFYQGYIKKCGNAAQTMVDIAYAQAKLKSGIVGVKVSIMPPDVRLPDDIIFREPSVEEVTEKVIEDTTEKSEEKKVDESLKDETKKTKTSEVVNGSDKKAEKNERE